MILRSLPFKINAAIITTAIIVSVFFSLILYPLEIKRSEEQLKRIHVLLETVFQQKINDLANELFAGQERALLATIKDIQTVDDIIGIDIYNKNGRLFITSNKILNEHYSTSGIKKITKDAVFETVKISDNYYGVYSSVIEVIGKKIGYIVMYYDLSSLKSESKRAITLISILPIATILLMGVLLNFFLFRSIIKPVSILRNAMREVEQGKLGETVALPGKDEIGDMSAAFNDMSRKMKINNEALIEAEAKYRSIFENAIEGIFQYSVRDGVFITVNPSMALILGYTSPNEVIREKRQIKESFFANTTDWENFDQTLQKAGRIIGFEAELLRRDGSTVWVSISSQRVFDDKGAPVFDEGSCIDITEHRQRMAAEQEREAAESASKAKSYFLAKMSHEIRTPLNAILGFADILESSIYDEKQKKYVNIIQSSGSNLLSLINDILDLSKIEAGRMDIRRSAVNFRSVIEELVKLFSVGAKEKDLTLSASFADSIPNFLLADGSRVRQILFNLIGNAVKFTEKGSVHIYCSAEKSDLKGKWNVKISVKDTGIGIVEESQKTIFESFRQNEVPGTIAEGTGLGLAITKHLLEMMNGDISVQSSPGSGSTFTVFLNDLRVVSCDDDTSFLNDEEELAVERIFDPACILIVDDLEVNRQHIKTSLKESPLKIIEAENGISAVAKAHKHIPDLILMDIFMPVADGYEAISRIRKIMTSSIPVVAITAAGMKEDIAKIDKAGFDDYLIRPFNKSQLLDKMSKFLNNSVVSLPQQDIGNYSGKEERVSSKPEYLSNWKCSLELAELLNNHFRQRWNEICRKQRIPDIVSFSEELSSLGRKHSIDALVSYGNDLRYHAENVDVDQLQKKLAYYTDFLHMMNAD